MTPKEAYEHAEKHGPSEETREIVCKDSCLAFFYAENVDKCREDTREAKVSNYAYKYTLDVNKCPREDARRLHAKIHYMHIIMQKGR